MGKATCSASKTGRITYLIVFIVSLIGCIYQIIYVSQQYFSYPTMTKVESELQDIVRYPSIILCARLLDISGDKNVTPDLLKDLSIKELHDRTPLINNTIFKCSIRIGKQRRWSAMTSQECYFHFSVKKYIVADQVCYLFQNQKGVNYSIQDIANSVDYGLYVYELQLTTPFNKTKELYFPANYPSITEDEAEEIRYPFQSLKFGEILMRYKSENYFIFRPYEEYFTLLEAPYDTDCVYKQNYFCYRDCLVHETRRQLAKFPFSAPANSSAGISNLRILTSRDLEDEEKSKTWKALQFDCGFKCRKPHCEFSITSNFMYHYYHYLHVNLTLSVSTPYVYMKRVTSMVVITWIDYVSGISQAISVWIGLSVLSVNPIVLSNRIALIRRRISKHVTCQRLEIIAYYVLCVSGFLYQSGMLCNQYFRYQTKSETLIEMSDEYQTQSLAFCAPYHILLDRRQHKTYGISPTSDYFGTMNELTLLNVDQIFHLTPKPKEVISDCGVRDEFNYELVSADNCSRLFHFKRAIWSDKICYFVIPRGFQKYLWTKVASAYRDSGHVYRIHLNISSHKCLMWTIISFQANNSDLPISARNFAQKVRIHPENTIITTSNTLRYSSLPPPYETRCEPLAAFKNCKETCLMNKINPLGRLPYSMLIRPPSASNGINGSFKIVTRMDMNDMNISRYVALTESYCKEKCSKNFCRHLVSFTESDTTKTKNDSMMRIYSNVPTAPTLIIDVLPATRPIDFFMYICNSFNIWFGASMLSFNPVTILTLLFAKLMQGRSYTTQGVRSLVVRNQSWARRQLLPKLLSFVKLVFLLFCVTGFGWQGYNFSKFFFSYRTIFRVEVQPVDELRFPNLVFCTQHGDFIRSENATIKDLFEATPSQNSTIIACSYRLDQTEEMKKWNTSHCRGRFTVLKYISGRDVCYAYFSPSFLKYSLSKIATAPTHVGFIYKIYLNQSLVNSTSMSFIAYTHTEIKNESFNNGSFVDYRKELPVVSRRYAARITRQLNTDSLNFFVIQGTLHSITLLPQPYDTQCITDDISGDFCESQCNLHFKKKLLNRIPFHEMIYEPLDVKMLSAEDLKNVTVAKIVKEGNQNCSKLCSRRPCNSYYSLTWATGYTISDKENLLLAAAVPKTNGITIKAYPTMTLIDLLSNIAASANIWLGVSVLSMFSFMRHLFTKMGNISKSNNKMRRIPFRERLEKRHRITKNPQYHCPCSYCRHYFEKRDEAIAMQYTVIKRLIVKQHQQR